MNIVIPADEATEFSALISTSTYRDQERDYKWAVHLVLAALLSPENSSREDWPQLIADVFGTPMPNLDRLGLKPEDKTFVEAALSDGGRLRGAMANLAGGGRWGLREFIWIPRAIEYGLGPSIADAFRALVATEQPLATRVDEFRDRLYVIYQTLEKKGGFEPNWTLFHSSLAFVALVLAGFDPSNYTFYSYGALKYGYQHYAPDTDWPKGTLGEKYTEVCEFVRQVGSELMEKGVSVRDLIDAQSFVWTRFQANKEAEPEPDTAKVITVPDLDTVAQDLAKTVYWPVERAQHLVQLVSKWGQIVFQGPPGTGKTFVAETLARLMAGDEEGRVEVVPFHPSYTYEDFVEGIRPVLSEGSQLQYEIRKGIFLKMADLAKQYPEDEFFLVIDELNRANLPRVLGDLLYALEYRGPQHPYRLLYSGGEGYVPENITLIGTMNTADRSIALVDAAIRRRFRHVRFDPDYKVLKAWLSDHGLNDIADYAAARLSALNQQLTELLDADRLIGHSYLMRKDLAEVGLTTVWEEDIEPVLREHLYNQPEEIAALHEVFVGTE